MTLGKPGVAARRTDVFWQLRHGIWPPSSHPRCGNRPLVERHCLDQGKDLITASQ
jgi:hypothetical protein